MEFKELGKTGVKIPVLGLGTWGIGGFSSSSSANDDAEVEALRLGLQLDMRFIDTAEMYGSGHSEEVVAKAIKSQRDSVFVATKVSANHLSHDGVLKSCEMSLKRLETSYIDLYQIHWPNTRIPISETMKTMERLVEEGKVRHLGVSNFSVRQFDEAQETLSKTSIVSNQVEYNLRDRSIERDLLPHAQSQHVTIIAYSPLAVGEIVKDGEGSQTIDEIAMKYGKTRSQVALSWLLLKAPVVAIPKAANLHHVRENAGATGWKLSLDDEDKLNNAFP